MKNNPFHSETFTKFWSTHFNGANPGINFQFLQGPHFYKAGPWPLYINMGKNLTKGIDYALQPTATDYRNKVVLMYDVADYFGTVSTSSDNNLGFYGIRQYPGFLVDLTLFPDFNAYMATTFSKSSRYKLNKYKKRLEVCFDISYKMYRGPIEEAEYTLLFDRFKTLLEKRFDDKGTTNNNLDPAEWNFYKDLCLPMIHEGNASLFVIYDGNRPIGITLCYFSEDILFDAITVFDIDYEKFHLGSVTIMKLLEWGLENQIRLFDFSKGDFDYKRRWSTKTYSFEYHLYYDRSNILCKILAWGIKTYFTAKQALRDKQYHEKFHRWVYALKNSGAKKQLPTASHSFLDLEPTYIPPTAPITLDAETTERLRPAIFDFLYLTTENYRDLKIYSGDGDGSYVFQGKAKTQQVQLQKKPQ